MSSILYNIFIMPIELVFRTLFLYCVDAPIVGIFVISIVMNFLALPLYIRADAIQSAERDKVNAMSKWVSHIKKTFKGDERYMMLNSYYEQEGYKPIYALRSALPLLLQIPFFMAAYNFLSNLSLLSGESFWIIKDLGAPDALFTIGNFKVNVLPILMTVINLVSSYIYLKGFPLKEKIQTYGIAVIFLVLLYDRPAGLVLYWTLNQVFSALKNVFMKLVKSRRAKNIFFSAMGVIAFVLFEVYTTDYTKISLIVFAICQVPLLLSIASKFIDFSKAKPLPTSVFVLGGFIVTALVGLAVPLSVISSSPSQFVFSSNTPSTIILYNLSLALGLFVVWFGIYYYLSNTRARNVFTYLMGAFAISALVNYFFVLKDFGSLTVELAFDEAVEFTSSELTISAVIWIAIAIVLALLLLFKQSKKLLPYAYAIILVSVVCLSAKDGIVLAKDITALRGEVTQEQASQEKQIIELSKNGKNVIVFELDRALGGYVPYIVHENPEIKEMFDGFTYYPNTLSFGTCTNFAAPALFGGYEYSVDKINARKDEKLKDKYNESLLVMPKLFSDNGFNVTVCDPPYAGYKEVPDLTIYKDIKNVKAYNTSNKYNEVFESEEAYNKKQRWNFFMYGLFQVSSRLSKEWMYDEGMYRNIEVSSVSHAFVEYFGVLCSLNNMVNIKDDASNNILLMQNCSTHEPTILKVPEYMPDTGYHAKQNIKYEAKTEDGEELRLNNFSQIGHYHINTASLLQLGKWFNYLRENGVYDNTRIIVVSDHGYHTKQFDKLIVDDTEFEEEFFNPLFMVKDFNETGFKTSNEFMTNADVPTIATKDLIDNPVNPYTNNKINSDAKKGKLTITTSRKHGLKRHTGNIFDTTDGQWWTVEKNIFDRNNWQFVRVGDKEE